MGLLALVASRARKVGLLPHVVALLPLLSLLLIISGLGMMATLPQEGMFRNTYLSENALLPHQAITFFRESDWDVVRGLKLEIRDIHKDEDRDEKVIKLFSSFGLDAFNHNNKTVYAFQKASRGPHNEAIVIAAPLFINNELNEGGAALLLGLSRSFKRWSFWQKNLVFVMPNTTKDLRDWITAYHTDLEHTAGSIEGAVVMEYLGQSEHFSSVDVVFEGLNGQLPNLDLLNVAIHSVKAEFSHPQILGNENSQTYMGRLRTMTRHIFQQARAGILPPSSSAMFSGWRIDAVTLRAVFSDQNIYDITTFGRVCESTARSINNLMEHFHQSFYFYLMLGTNYFVSIASFLPAAMLIGGGFTVMAIYLIFRSSSNASEAAQAGVSVLITTLLSSTCGYFWAVHRPIIALFTGILLALFALALSFKTSRNTRRVVYAAALALAGLELSALGMINFSLSLMVGTFMAPLAFIRPKRSWLSSVWNIIVVTLACPVSILTVLAIHYFNMSLTELILEILNAFRSLSVWTWMVVWGVWVPLWIAACVVA